MIYEALLKIFGDKERAWRALGMLVNLMESHGESYGCDDWNEEYREIYSVLLSYLRREFRGWL